MSKIDPADRFSAHGAPGESMTVQTPKKLPDSRLEHFN